MRKGLELIIDEPVPGHFYWPVLDRVVFGQPRRALDNGPGPYRTRAEALSAGTAAMRRHFEPQRLVADAGDSLR